MKYRILRTSARVVFGCAALACGSHEADDTEDLAASTLERDGEERCDALCALAAECVADHDDEKCHVWCTDAIGTALEKGCSEELLDYFDCTDAHSCSEWTGEDDACGRESTAFERCSHTVITDVRPG